MKRKFYSEAAYIIGLVILVVGNVFMTKADFGLSMVIAPAYLLHLKISVSLPFFTFGMAEYTLQAFLLIMMALVLRKFRISYIFSFVTALLYGFILDGVMAALSWLPTEGLTFRIIYFIIGFFLCAVGISLLFHTYISPEAYELAVKEISRNYSLDITRVKMVYDCCSLAVSVILSFAFFGKLVAINIGTFISAVANGWLIGKFSSLFEKRFVFSDRFELRKYF